MLAYDCAHERVVDGTAGDSQPAGFAPSYNLGPMTVAASAEVMTGITSKSTRSAQLAIHASRSALSSVSITW